MSKYLTPLWIFLGGQVMALIIFLFLGAIGTSVDQVHTDTAAIGSAFWNWDLWTNSSVVKFAIIILVELLTLYGTAKAFLKMK